MTKNALKAIGWVIVGMTLMGGDRLVCDAIYDAGNAEE